MPVEIPSCSDSQWELLRKILLSLDDIGGSSTTLCGFTPTAVPFAGADGCLTEDPTDFYYDAVNNALTVGVARLLSKATNNLFLGQSAGNFTVTGSRNVGVGTIALTSITNGTDNIAFGASTLQAVTTQFNNVAIGTEALFSNTANANIAIGKQVSRSNTTGSQNVAVGHLALFANILGSQNTALGYQSLTAIATGSNNTAVGAGSMAVSTGSTANTAVGSGALSATTGSNNTGTGRNSLTANTTGASNVASGHSSLLSNTTGSQNVAVGFEAGVTATPANANVTGGNNTYVGYRSGPGVVTQLTNSSAFGFRALVSASNSLALGGIGADVVSVGIGFAAPNSRLQVSGAISTPIATKTVAYPVVSTDGTILVDATAAPVTITLPTPVGIDGRRYTVKKIDATANLVTIATAAGTIDGAATKTTAVQYTSFDFVSNGANWFIV